MQAPAVNSDDSSSPTYTVESKDLRKGGYAIIKGMPARIMDVSWSKMGKVGYPKVFYTAIDLVTGKVVDELLRAWDRGAHPAQVPRTIHTTEYILLGFIQNGSDSTYLKLLPLDEDNDEINDRVLLPQRLGDAIRNDFEQGKQLVITVHSVLDHEGVVSYKEQEDEQEDKQNGQKDEQDLQ